MRESTIYRLDQPPMPEDIRSNRLQRQLPPAVRGSPNRHYALRPNLPAERSSIYVGNLPITVTQEQLMELFGRYGHIVGIEIVSKPSVHGKCFTQEMNHTELA